MTSLKCVYRVEELTSCWLQHLCIFLVLYLSVFWLLRNCSAYWFLSIIFFKQRDQSWVSNGKKVCSWPEILIGFGLAKMQASVYPFAFCCKHFLWRDFCLYEEEYSYTYKPKAFVWEYAIHAEMICPLFYKGFLQSSNWQEETMPCNSSDLVTQHK